MRNKDTPEDRYIRFDSGIFGVLVMKTKEGTSDLMFVQSRQEERGKRHLTVGQESRRVFSHK